MLFFLLTIVLYVLRIMTVDYSLVSSHFSG